MEYITCGDTSIAAPVDNVWNKIKELSEVYPSTDTPTETSSTDKTGFEIQFEVNS